MLSLAGRLEERMGDLAEIAGRTLCVSCGYDLRGLSVAGKCPECGTEASRSVPQCPRCGESGESVIALACEQEHPGVWTCGRCGGIGLEPGKLRRTLHEWQPPGGRAVLQPPDLSGQTVVKCGRCRTTADSFMVAGTIMVDRCGSCGFLWLDANEFESVATYLKNMAGSRPLPSNVDAMLHDPAAIRQQIVSPSLRTWVIIDLVAATLATLLS